MPAGLSCPDRLRHIARGLVHGTADRIKFTVGTYHGPSCYGLAVLVPLLSTLCCHNAVTVRYLTATHRKEGDFHPSVCVPSQAHGRQRPRCPRQPFPEAMRTSPLRSHSQSGAVSRCARRNPWQFAVDCRRQAGVTCPIQARMKSRFRPVIDAVTIFSPVEHALHPVPGLPIGAGKAPELPAIVSELDAGSGSLRLKWPAGLAGVRLQQADRLKTPMVWRDVEGGPDGEYKVPMPSAGQVFFRLHHRP